MLNRIAAGLCIAMVVASASAQDRVSASEKGSVLIFPKVELRWNAAGDLIQDTFISITNDQNQAVNVHMYFVSEACTNVDNDILLTRNQPSWWSAFSGLPKGVSPFTVLGAPIPDPEGTGDEILRGYIVAFAVNADIEQIRWNHLFGEATIVNYADGTAWEYTAYAFQAIEGQEGDVVGTPGMLDLDGVFYDAGFNRLLLNFFAAGSTAFSGGGAVVTHDTDLTLLILDQDLRQDNDGPFTTKAQFYIWNENEVGFSGMEYCITKWDESLLSARGGHFLVGNLQTNKGYARIDGMASQVCDVYDMSGQPVTISTDHSLLGVAAKILTFNGVDVATAGTHLVGSGTESAYIKYDVPGSSEEKILAPAFQNATNGILRR
jgi:hypothetical protein